MGNKNGVYLKCEHCGKDIYKTRSQFDKREHHYCSNKCQSLHKRDITFEYKPCEVCGAEMYISKKSSKRFCSVKCQSMWQRGNFGLKNKRFQGGYVVCENCGVEFLVGKTVYESDRHHFCSSSCRQKWYAEVWSQSEDWRNKSRKRAAIILRNNVNKHQTKPQIAVNEMLDRLLITYENETPFDYYAVDNYLPDYNLIVEVMGDYWHSSPIKYPECKNDKQRHIVSRDKAKHTYIKKRYGIEILYLWESDVLKNAELCERLISHYINSNGIIKNYNSFNYRLKGGDLMLADNLLKSHQEK